MQRQGQRKGFTLIELLVVMGIITVLAGMAFLIGPVLQRTQASARGAEMVQSTLFNAKQIALRDRALYGVRLLVDTNGQSTSLQYIFQPPDYVDNSVVVDAVTDPSLKTLKFSKDISGGLTDQGLWPVQVGDFIQIQSSAQPRRIATIVSNIQVTTASANNGPTNAPPTPMAPTTDFRIMRAPRPVPGEEQVLLPQNIIIDGALSQITQDSATGQFDILFAPAGPVVGDAGRSGKIILWVRDVTVNPATTDEQTLITVFTRSGSIGSYAVDTSSGLLPPNPASTVYSFTYDPRANGL